MPSLKPLATGRRALPPARAAVKLSGLVVRAAADGHAPRTVKLFTNQPSLGFSEAASEPPTQQFALSEEDLDGRPLALRRAPRAAPVTALVTLGLKCLWARRGARRTGLFPQLCPARRRTLADLHALSSWSGRGPACRASPASGARCTRMERRVWQQPSRARARRRFVKFQNVTTLSVFIEDNQGEEDSTRLRKLALLGQPAEKMDVAAIKKAGEEEG